MSSSILQFVTMYSFILSVSHKTTPHTLYLESAFFEIFCIHLFIALPLLFLDYILIQFLYIHKGISTNSSSCTGIHTAAKRTTNVIAPIDKRIITLKQMSRVISVADKGMTTGDKIWYTINTPAHDGYVFSMSIRIFHLYHSFLINNY